MVMVVAISLGGIWRVRAKDSEIVGVLCGAC